MRTLFARPPSLQYLLGAFEVEEVQTKKPERRAPKVLDRDLVATRATQLAERCANPTEARVQHVMAQLVRAFKQGGKAPVGYFDFVIDPDSFSATVENIFHVTFLVKEDKVKIWVDEQSKLPVIVPIKARPAGSQTEERKNQVVISINMDQWRRLAKALNITSPMIASEDSNGDVQDKRTRKQ